MSNYIKLPCGAEIDERRDGVIEVGVWYPRNDGGIATVELDLVDVRASDGLRVTFCFERNGWIVEQPIISTDEDGDESQEWREVYFAESYALDADR